MSAPAPRRRLIAVSAVAGLAALGGVALATQPDANPGGADGTAPLQAPAALDSAAAPVQSSAIPSYGIDEPDYDDDFGGFDVEEH